jgi:hypothetical protein
MDTPKDTGPLDWRIAIVGQDGRPTPEFQRRWATQRSNNALIGTITFGSGAPSGKPDDGAEYVDTDATPPALYVGHSGTWLKIGPFKFVQLSDVPNSYTGAGSKLLRVNSGANAVEFAALSSVLDGISSTRGTILYRGASGWTALAPGTAGNVLQTGGAGADPSWVAGGGGGGVSGTWTPVLSFGGASVGITYSVQLGIYTQIGKLVFVNMSLQISSKGSSTGNAAISGLPFGCNTTTNQFQNTGMQWSSGITGAQWSGFLGAGGGVATTAFTIANGTGTILTQTAFGAGTQLIGNWCYMTN